MTEKYYDPEHRAILEEKRKVLLRQAGSFLARTAAAGIMLGVAGKKIVLGESLEGAAFAAGGAVLSVLAAKERQQIIDTTESIRTINHCY